MMKTLDGPLPGKILFYLRWDKAGKTEHLIRLLAAMEDITGWRGAKVDVVQAAKLTDSRPSAVRMALDRMVKNDFLIESKDKLRLFDDKPQIYYRASGKLLEFIVNNC